MGPILSRLSGRVRRYRPGCLSWSLVVSAGLAALIVPAVRRARDAASMAQLT